MQGTVRTIEVDVLIPEGHEYVRFDHAQSGEMYVELPPLSRVYTNHSIDSTHGRYAIIRKATQYREPGPGDEGKEIEVRWPNTGWEANRRYVGRMSNGNVVYEKDGTTWDRQASETRIAIGP